MKDYYVYILVCHDGSFYIGVTNNTRKRLAEHNEGIDHSCYTYARRPVVLVYHELHRDAMNAIRREKQLKHWSRAKKEALIENDPEKLKRLSKSHASTSSA